MLALQDSEGIVFCPAHEVVSLVRDHPLRWRAVLRDGSVLHLPGVKPEGPWVALGEVWVLPQFLTVVEGGYLDPAGFFWPGGPLAPVSLPAPASQAVPGLPCGLERVFSLEGRAEGVTWHTDDGDYFFAGASAAQVASNYPDLVMMRRGLFVNRTRLRRIVPLQPGRGDQKFALWSDSGVCIGEILKDRHEEAARRFGLAHFSYLEPDIPGMRRERLRDWPVELARQRTPFLQAHFEHPTLLMAHILWQALRHRQLGKPLDYDYEYRGFFYSAVQHVLFRAGFLTRGMPKRFRKARRVWTEDELWVMFQRVAAELVGEDRLFTFRELGFSDPAPYYRCIGTTRPEVVVLAEKTSEEPVLQYLRETHGVTTVITGGKPRHLAVEFFVLDLMARLSGPVRLIAYVDYDPSGWQIARTFVAMLERYGVTVIPEIVFVPRAEHFQAEEIELFALPCPSGTPTENANWVAASGGIDGEALGLHCNDLRPVDRLYRIFEGLL